ncbi:MAG: hypothetical protein HC859_04830 [Bacteroidia bacterium]|nr:hypothetical protein [Bacteroidia bacterium]
MIAFRHLTYQSGEDPETVFSRLKWAVEQVDNLHELLANNSAISTNRNWVGVLDAHLMTFALVEPREWFRARFVQVVIRGKITPDGGEKSEIEIQMRLGWHTLFAASCATTLTLVMLIGVAAVGTLADAGAIVPFVLLTTAYFMLIRRRMNLVERKVEALFGLEV